MPNGAEASSYFLSQCCPVIFAKITGQHWLKKYELASAPLGIKHVCKKWACL
jgi:hypothetical protein